MAVVLFSARVSGVGFTVLVELYVWIEFGPHAKPPFYVFPLFLGLPKDNNG